MAAARIKFENLNGALKKETVCHVHDCYNAAMTRVLDVADGVRCSTDAET